MLFEGLVNLRSGMFRQHGGFKTARRPLPKPARNKPPQPEPPVYQVVKWAYVRRKAVGEPPAENMGNTGNYSIEGLEPEHFVTLWIDKAGIVNDMIPGGYAHARGHKKSLEPSKIIERLDWKDSFHHEVVLCFDVPCSEFKEKVKDIYLCRKFFIPWDDGNATLALYDVSGDIKVHQVWDEKEDVPEGSITTGNEILEPGNNSSLAPVERNEQRLKRYKDYEQLCQESAIDAELRTQFAKLQDRQKQLQLRSREKPKEDERKPKYIEAPGVF